jgi:oxygen-independent coproporphyrinogen-3 oxidase
MYYIKIQGHPFENEIREMMLQYFHGENIKILKDYKSIYTNEDYVITSAMKEKSNYYIIYTLIEKDGQKISKEELQVPIPLLCTKTIKDKLIKRKLKITLYYAMKIGFNRTLPWGILTGIRPTKIVHKLINEGITDEKIIGILKSNYLLTHKKAILLMDVTRYERDIIYPTNKNKIGLYIGIPFCPSRCIYCSFLSSVLGKNRDILKEYLEALKVEIREIGEYINKNNINIESIYIGGGTPTILNSNELKELLSTIEKEIDINQVKEYSLEAGRPDTINKDKLKIAIQHRVNRISINPQTMNENTLINIGRMHSPEDIIKSYKLAREVGFSIINMDLILGLPGENTDIVKETLKQIEELQPENLTIHTMSIKKGSELKAKLGNIKFDQEENITEMLEATQDFAVKNGYIPYYLYRQKYMMGNLENVGYCKKDYKSIYNIQMMSEKQTIIGLGAGSVTKVIFLDEDRIERMPNVKDIKQYIQRIHELINRKLLLLNSLYKPN